MSAPYTVDNVAIAKALVTYWEQQYAHVVEARPFGQNYQISPVDVDGEQHPFWREVNDSFVAGWEAGTRNQEQL